MKGLGLGVMGLVAVARGAEGRVVRKTADGHAMNMTGTGYTGENADVVLQAIVNDKDWEAPGKYAVCGKWVGVVSYPGMDVSGTAGVISGDNSAAAAVVNMTVGGQPLNATTALMGHVHGQTCTDGPGPHWMLSTTGCAGGGSSDPCYNVPANEVHVMGKVDATGMAVLTNVGSGKNYAAGATEGNPAGTQSAMGQSIVLHHTVNDTETMWCCTLTWKDGAGGFLAGHSHEGHSHEGHSHANAAAPAAAAVSLWAGALLALACASAILA